ncbi:hypothetical protein EXIGLDRAFT_766289 [Exidia glandulosa HHB12029]|uniref:JmjC domain-containing protein n=1 Tax=Exidia glandulosa HHB12029 TaxID=1314781 RepID=A0A165JV46_EXIGL|nr:hypothetical protein EXIGLDRAFT_766289 [Exidia glandulosa HHB12029]
MVRPSPAFLHTPPSTIPHATLPLFRPSVDHEHDQLAIARPKKKSRATVQVQVSHQDDEEDELEIENMMSSQPILSPPPSRAATVPPSPPPVHRHGSSPPPSPLPVHETSTHLTSARTVSPAPVSFSATTSLPVPRKLLPLPPKPNFLPGPKTEPSTLDRNYDAMVQEINEILHAPDAKNDPKFVELQYEDSIDQRRQIAKYIGDNYVVLLHGRPSPRKLDWDRDSFTECFAGRRTNPQYSDGAGTALYVEKGRKEWYYLRLDPSLDSASARACATLAISRGNRESCTPYVLTLLPGDVLIQPPNLVHRVYTPERSIVTGSHFYAYQSLHLSEQALLIDHHKGDITTNEEHPDAIRIYARMVLSLGDGAFKYRRTIPLRALHVFRRLMDQPTKYKPQLLDTTKARSTEDDHELYMREQHADIKLACVILDLIFERDHLESPPKSSDQPGGPWDDAAGPLIDVAPLPLPQILKELEEPWSALKSSKSSRPFFPPPATMRKLHKLVAASSKSSKKPRHRSPSLPSNKKRPRSSSLSSLSSLSSSGSDITVFSVA